MKNFEFDPTSFSKTTYNIGGINVYVYNGDALESYISQFNEKAATQAGHDGNNRTDWKVLPINVMYLVHYRGGDYKFTESVAYNVLKQYYAHKGDKTPLICVTFDNRNHGERLIDAFKNRSWKSGNNTHGVDMISMIRGGVDDLKLVMDYLPSYLNLEYLFSKQVKHGLQTEIRFKNVLSGYSGGAHTIIRFANKFPELVDVIHPVVGCSDLSSLLINRLVGFKNGDAEFNKKWFYHTYEELPLSDEQRQSNYPEVFHKLLSKEDEEIFENFPFSKVKLFASFGEDDTLVPATLSKSWVQMYENTNEASKFVIHKGVGHEATPEMIEQFTNWLVEHI